MSKFRNPFRRMNGSSHPHLISSLVERKPSLFARLRCQFGGHVYKVNQADYYSISTHCFNCGVKSPRGYGE